MIVHRAVALAFAALRCDSRIRAGRNQDRMDRVQPRRREAEGLSRLRRRRRRQRPAVLVIHAREGMTENTKKNVEMFAKFGYCRLRGRHLRLRQRAAQGRARDAGETTMYNQNRTLLKARTQAGYDVLAGLPCWSMRVKDRAGRLLLRQHRGRVRLDRRTVAATLTFHGLVRQPPAGLGQEPQGPDADHARRRRCGLSADRRRGRGRGASRRQGRLPVRGL